MFGLLTIMVGIAAALLLGVVTDRTRSYKLLLLITFAGCALAYALFALVLRPSRTVLVGVLCSCVGFFNTALAPVSLGKSKSVALDTRVTDLSSQRPPWS